MNLLTTTILSLCLAPSAPQEPAAKLTPVAQDPAAATKKLDTKIYDHYGAGITAGKNVDLATALKNPAAHTNKKVRIEGEIDSICQTKGCWMQLGKTPERIFVKFTDYAFFVPKDASGRTAIIEGTMKFKQETVAETRHYLEDAGKIEEAKKVTEGRKIYTFMADGVAIQKAATKLDSNHYDHFGAGIVEGDNVALATALQAPEKYSGKKVRIEGEIDSICQTKGCWMQLGKTPERIFVKFTDYAFFVPKDASGRTAIIEGTMKFKQETVAETKHYLEDAGKIEEAKKVTEGRKIYTFMADGVAIQKVAIQKAAGEKQGKKFQRLKK